MRAHVYAELAARAVAPSTTGIALALDATEADVATALRRLHAEHVLVLDPDSERLLFAAPFSAVRTGYSVEINDRSYFAPCAWDALGIAAALDRDATIRSTCEDCGSALTVTVAGGKVAGDAHVAHFHLPARRWWDDIAFT